MPENTIVSIGQQLRDARVEKNLTLEKIAETLRIHLRFLKALEEERWSELPARVYLEGFLKQYAILLGLNGAQLVKDLREKTQTGEKPPFMNPQPVPESAEHPGVGGVRVPFLLLAAALIVSAGVYIYRSQETARSQRKISLPATFPEPGSAPMETPGPPTPAGTAPGAKNVPAPEGLAAGHGVPAPNAAAPAALHTLSVRSLDTVWLRVWIDGAVRYEGLLNAGEQRAWTGANFKVRAGNMSRAQISFDGTAWPSSTSSNPGEIQWPSAGAPPPADPATTPLPR